MYECRRVGGGTESAGRCTCCQVVGRRGTHSISPGVVGSIWMTAESKREVDNRKKKNRGGCNIPVGGAGPLFLVGMGGCVCGCGCAAAAVGALCCACACVCLPEPPQVSLPAPADLHLLRALTCIFQFLGGGYPGTWEHSFIHSFIHSSSYTTHLYGRPSWNPCSRRIPRYYDAGGRRKKRSCCAPVVQIAHTVPGPWGPTVTRGFPSHSSTRRQACATKLPQWLQGGVDGVGASIFSLPLSVPLSSFLFLTGVSPSRPVCPTGDTPSDLEPLTEEGLPAPTRRACHYSNGSPINNVCHNTRCIETGVISSDLGLLAQATCSYSGSPGPRKSFGCTCSMISN